MMLNETLTCCHFTCGPAASRSLTFLGKVRPREGRREEGMKEGREGGRVRRVDFQWIALEF